MKTPPEKEHKNGLPSYFDEDDLREALRQPLSATDFKHSRYHGSTGCSHPGVISLTVRTAIRERENEIHNT